MGRSQLIDATLIPAEEGVLYAKGYQAVFEFN